MKVYECLEEPRELYLTMYDQIGFNLVNLSSGGSYFSKSVSEIELKRTLETTFNYLGTIESVNLYPQVKETKNYKI